MPIDAEAAADAVTEKIAAPLGLSRDRAALGIFEVVNANMIGGIRSVSIERGYDPRDFRLVAGGGATSAHAGRLAAELGIGEVLIPKVASGLCAFGEAVADVKHTYLASYTVTLHELEPKRLNDLFERLERQGRDDLALEGFSDDEITVGRSIEMKYVDQVHECSVELPVFEITAERVPAIEDAFHRRHEALYTYCERDNTPELINVEVNVYGRSPAIEVPSANGRATAAPPATTERPCYFEDYGDYRTTPVFDGRRLRSGAVVEGPAIVEEETTTIVVFPGSTLRLPRPDLYVMNLETGVDG
jgi:N-methylhydantoinase A